MKICGKKTYQIISAQAKNADSLTGLTSAKELQGHQPTCSVEMCKIESQILLCVSQWVSQLNLSVLGVN